MKLFLCALEFSDALVESIHAGDDEAAALAKAREGLNPRLDVKFQTAEPLGDVDCDEILTLLKLKPSCSVEEFYAASDVPDAEMGLALKAGLDEAKAAAEKAAKKKSPKKTDDKPK